MKALLILSLVPTLAFCQDDPADTLKFDYAGIELVQGVSANVLQARARVFITENFKERAAVTQLDDTIANILVIKGYITPTIPNWIDEKVPAGYVSVTAKFQFKNGKYKYTLYAYEHQGMNRNSPNGGDLREMYPKCGIVAISRGRWHKIKRDVDQQTILLLANLKTAMNSGEISGDKDNFR